VNALYWKEILKQTKVLIIVNSLSINEPAFPEREELADVSGPISFLTHHRKG